MKKDSAVLAAWKQLARELQEHQGYTLTDLIAELTHEGDAVPLTAFGHGMTPLEAVTRYLHHTGNDTAAIATALGRPRAAIERMLAHSHLVAKSVHYGPSERVIPVSAFATGVPASQALCLHLRERYGMTNKQIADALGIDQRTVWTVLDRERKRQQRPARPTNDTRHYGTTPTTE